MQLPAIHLFSATKRILAAAVILLLGAGAVLGIRTMRSQPEETVTKPAATSFEECMLAGFPVMESWPRRCRDGQGVLYTETIAPDLPAPVEPVAESWGRIYGTVLLGPMCPVEMNPPDPRCADRAHETRLALTTSDGSRVIREFGSDAQGRFSLDVPAGTYLIRSVISAHTLPYCGSTEAIVVPINDSVEVAVFCDTGIR